MKRSGRQKAKAEPQNGHSRPDQDAIDNYERHINGDITVRGQLEVHAPPNLIQKEDTERDKDRTHTKKEFIVSLVTLGFVVFYAGLTAWLGHSAKITADSAIIDQRPYVVIKFPILTPKFVPGVPLLTGVTLSISVGLLPSAWVTLSILSTSRLQPVDPEMNTSWSHRNDSLIPSSVILLRQNEMAVRS
jgi:hypothetical protein